MWIANKPFRYRGVSYASGDIVPADKWPTRRFFVARRVIVQVSDPQPVPLEVLPIGENQDAGKALTDMTRAELEDYAFMLGIDDPDPTVLPVEDTLLAQSPNLEAMTRAQLEDFAFSSGIDNPESYPNKTALIAAIEEALTAPEGETSS